MKANLYDLIGKVFYAVDTFLYKTFGFVSETRKESWHKNAINLQCRLDHEHSRRDRYNKLNGTFWTTQKALMERDLNVL